MSSKVAEADRYLKTQQQDNDTEEKHSLTIQYSTVEFSQVVVNNMQLSFRCFKPKNSRGVLTRQAVMNLRLKGVGDTAGIPDGFFHITQQNEKHRNYRQSL